MSEEARTYLHTRQIPKLVDKLIGSLIEAQPDDPVAFLRKALLLEQVINDGAPSHGKYIYLSLGAESWGIGGDPFVTRTGRIHEAVHDSMNKAMPNVRCYSVFPCTSETTKTYGRTLCRVVEAAQGSVPSTASLAQNHLGDLSPDSLVSYQRRYEALVADFIEHIEEEEGTPPCVVMCYGLFPTLVMFNVNRHRVLMCMQPIRYITIFATGTVEDEVATINVMTPLKETGVFGSTQGCVHSCYCSSSSERSKLISCFPKFDDEKVFVANLIGSVPRLGSYYGGTQQPDIARALRMLDPPIENPQMYNHLVVFHGQIRKEKQLENLIDACMVYEQALEPVKVATVIVGPGFNAADLKSTRHLFVCNPVSTEILAYLLHSASVCVFPQHISSYGTILESLRAGAPVIVNCITNPAYLDVNDALGRAIPANISGRVAADMIAESVVESVKGNWKKSKGEACRNAAQKVQTFRTVMDILLKADAVPSNQRGMRMGPLP